LEAVTAIVGGGRVVLDASRVAEASGRGVRLGLALPEARAVLTGALDGIGVSEGAIPARKNGKSSSMDFTPSSETAKNVKV
jgi:hypothetical protein